MSKLDLPQLLDDLTRGVSDPLQFENYYDQAVFELARAGQLVEATLVESEKDTTSYAIPTRAVNILAVLYGSLELTEIPRMTLEVVNSLWRQETGTPIGYVIEDEQANTFRLYPIPVQDSEPMIPIYFSPLGRDLPSNAVVLIYTVARENTQDFYDLPLALDILSRDFSRDSRHQDTDFSIVCNSLAQLFLGLVNG